MKRAMAVVALTVLLMQAADPSLARRKTVIHRGPRTKVVIHHGFPIRRALPVVVVRAPRVRIVTTPAVYLAPVVWTAAVISLPAADRLVWQDTELLSKDDDWTDFSLGVDARGTALLMKVAGKMQLNFSEVVFDNGQAQVVDFNEKTYKDGVYTLLNFKDGRKVSHVRMVGRAKSDEARLTLYMDK